MHPHKTCNVMSQKNVVYPCVYTLSMTENIYSCLIKARISVPQSGLTHAGLHTVRLHRGHMSRSASFTASLTFMYAVVWDNVPFYCGAVDPIWSPIYWLMDIPGGSSLGKLLSTSRNKSFKKLLLNVLTISYMNKVPFDYWDSSRLTDLPPTPIDPLTDIFCSCFCFFRSTGLNQNLL